jgi:hypothetical protein
MPLCSDKREIDILTGGNIFSNMASFLSSEYLGISFSLTPSHWIDISESVRQLS